MKNRERVEHLRGTGVLQLASKQRKPVTLVRIKAFDEFNHQKKTEKRHMKQIIDGLRYDTERAVLIGEAGWNGSRDDFHWWEAGLYRTESGRHFLAGKGGPMSRWARSVDSGGTSGSEGIIPLDIEETREWAEDHLSLEKLEEFFPDWIKDA